LAQKVQERNAYQRPIFNQSNSADANPNVEGKAESNSPDENIFDAPPGGVFRGKGGAYYLMLEPLPPGQHELRLTSSVFQGPGSECNSSSDVTYQINVK
jgi:hypothetical protein